MALLETLLEVRKHIRSGADSANEQSTKAWCILPILQALGWNGPERLTSEVRLGQNEGKADYALLGSRRTPLLPIEAKSLQHNLNEKHVSQVLSYCESEEQVSICALTNGAQWWLFLPQAEGEPLERCFAALDVQGDEIGSLVEVFTSCLSYDAVTTGNACDRASDLLDEMASEKVLLDAVNRAVDRIVSFQDFHVDSLVQDAVSRTTRPLPSDHERIDHYMKALRNHASRYTSMGMTQARADNALSLLSAPVRLYAKHAGQTYSIVYTLFGVPHEEDHRLMAERVARELHARQPDVLNNRDTLPETVSMFFKEDPYGEITDELEDIGWVEQIWFEGDLYLLIPSLHDTLETLAYELLDAYGYSSDELRIYARQAELGGGY